MNLTEDQKAQIIARSREARAFLQSSLYKEIEKWVESEQAYATQAIVLDRREDSEKDLTREQFVERKCAYYQALPTMLGVIKGFAGQEQQLATASEGVSNDRTDTSTSQNNQ